MPKSLRNFLEQVKTQLPDQYVEVRRPIDPAKHECTAILEHLTREQKFPLVKFVNPKNLRGEDSEMPIVSNVYARRERCAIALDWPVDQAKQPLSLEYSRLREEKISPQIISKEDAPVKEIVLRGAEADPALLPGVLHYEKDLCPVFTMTLIMKDPDTGIYDISFIKTFYKGSQRLGCSIHSPHLERILDKYEKMGKPAPVVNVIGHHPAFYLGSMALVPYDNDDYSTIGSFLREPLRLVPSETWGEDFMVPADAEILIEGEIVPGHKELVDPFGEITRHYQAQCLRQAMDVTAITRRKDAILMDIFSGHHDHWNLGGIAKEGSLYRAVDNKLGTVTGAHIPYSGCGTLSCYISIDNKRDGDAKLAGLTALLENCHTLQLVVVVDKDIDVFNEQDVIWAVNTCCDFDRDITIIEKMRSVFTMALGQKKVIIDATRPLDRAYPDCFKLPDSVMERIKLDEWIEK